MNFALKIIVRIASIIIFITFIRWGGLKFMLGLIIGMLSIGWMLLTDNIQVKSILKLFGVADYETNTKNQINKEIKEENKYKVKFSR